MAEFLVELYVSRAASGAVAIDLERARLAAEQLTSEGTPVRCVRSILVPDDETCLCLYDAVSVEAVREMSVRAGLELERISAAVACTNAEGEGCS
jgi:hypothetical protein